MTRSDEKPTGIAAAALTAAAIGLLALAISHLAAAYSDGMKNWVHDWGKAWMPNASKIGPYSGKETLALLAWWISWIALHFTLRKKEVDLAPFGLLFLGGIGLATTLLWPPAGERVLHLLKGAP